MVKASPTTDLAEVKYVLHLHLTVITVGYILCQLLLRALSLLFMVTVKYRIPSNSQNISLHEFSSKNVRFLCFYHTCYMLNLLETFCL
jgi:hypothetical protein